MDQEALAEALHRAETQVVYEEFAALRPKWFALAAELKEPIRARAAELMERYGAQNDASPAEARPTQSNRVSDQPID